MSDSKRSLKTTSRQFATMVDFIGNNKKMINTKLTPDFTAQDKEELWVKLTQLLNADGLGPSKSVAKWKKTWADYECEVKNKVAEYKRRQRQTGGGPPPEDLPPLYEKTAEIIGYILIVGDEKIQETGRKNVENGSQVLKETNSEELIMQVDDDTSHIFSAKHSRRKKTYTETPVPNMTQLITEEKNKALAINAVAAAIERSNEMQEKKNEIEIQRNEIERQKNEIQRKRNEIENERNDIIDSAVDSFLKFFTKT